MLEQVFDFRAVAVFASFFAAFARVEQEFHGSLDLRRAVLALGLRQRRAISGGTTLSHEGVLVTSSDAAVVANIEIGARLAAPTLSGLELA